MYLSHSLSLPSMAMWSQRIRTTCQGAWQTKCFNLSMERKQGEVRETGCTIPGHAPSPAAPPSDSPPGSRHLQIHSVVSVEQSMADIRA